MKRCSISLVVKEMRIKTIMSALFTHPTRTRTKNTRFGRNEHLELSQLVTIWNGAVTLESRKFLGMGIVEFLYEPQFNSRHPSGRNDNLSAQKRYTNADNSITRIARNVFLPTDEQTKTWYILTVEYYLATKTNGILINAATGINFENIMLR